MRRGDIWTVSGAGDYAGKPRPAVIVQDDHFDLTASVTLCGFTSQPEDAPLLRVLVEPSAENGLKSPSRLMVDKLTTVHRSKLGSCIGRLAAEDMIRLNRAMLVFLGMAGGGEPG